MNLHADVRAIRAAAPRFANFLVCDREGDLWWQSYIEPNSYWDGNAAIKWVRASLVHGGNVIYAICLTTGSVHLQDESGKIVVVPQSAWVAARNRKARGKGTK
jgi:hypothetical protein